MRKGISKFAFVMLAATAGLVLGSCKKQPAKSKDVTYKFYSMTVGTDVYNIGDEYYGVTLDENFQTITLKSNGTFTDVTRVIVSTETYDHYTGTYTHTGTEYTLHYETMNEEPIASPYDIEFTIENGVMIEHSGYGFETVLHKA